MRAFNLVIWMSLEDFMSKLFWVYLYGKVFGNENKFQLQGFVIYPISQPSSLHKINKFFHQSRLNANKGIKLQNLFNSCSAISSSFHTKLN